MNPNRRQVLKGLGAGVAISCLGTPVSAVPTDRVFVHPRANLVGDVLDAVTAIGGTPLLEYENFPFIVASVPPEKREELRSDLRVAFIENDNDVGIPTDWTPTVPDPLVPGDDFDCSTHPAQRPSWGIDRIGADTIAGDGSGVDVGILDTGIETDHCSLAVAGGRNVTEDVWSNDYEDRHGHGTHVAGVVGARDNGIGVVGVAPNTNLYAVKVLDDTGSGRYSTLVAGIDWCMSNDVELISMSLGGEAESTTVDQAIEAAYAAGHLLLCAAGNNENNGDGSCNEETMTYPATHEDVVAVAAMNEDDTLASYSSVGSGIELLAPGTNIDSTYVDNGYARASGTSIACPFVTGVAALRWQTQDVDGPGPNESVRTVLAETAETVLGTCEEGYGLVDARAATGDNRTTDNGGQRATNGGHSTDSNGDANGGERTGSLIEQFIRLVDGFIDYIRAAFR